MLPMIDARIISAFMLMVDNQILTQGQAYLNVNSFFYPTQSYVNGWSCYTAPYKQLCNDISISGANIMSGVYLNGTYTTIGQSGMVAINHADGAVYFNTPLPSQTIISGNFAVKEFSVYLADQPDYKLLFESKFESNPKYTNNIPTTGLSLEDKTAPSIHLVIKSQEQKPLAFAGIDNNSIRIRAIIICDSVYQKVCACNILKNFHLHPVPVPAIGATNLDYLGNCTGLNYNYTGMALSNYYVPIVMSARVIELPEKGEYQDIKKQMAIVDFEISTWAGHS